MKHTLRRAAFISNVPMNTAIKHPFMVSVISALGLMMLAGPLTAQTFMTLYSFTAVQNATNSDGRVPLGRLNLSQGVLYGTTTYGGYRGNGTIFAVNTDSTGFTNLHSFTALGPIYNTNSDGVNPWAGLIRSGNTLYGTAFRGGVFGSGNVFAIETDGTG